MGKQYLLAITCLITFFSLISCEKDNFNGDSNSNNSITLYQIEGENLNGWDGGVSDGKNCIVYKTKSNNGYAVCLLGHTDSTYSFILDLDENLKVTGFGTPDIYYAIKETEDQYLLHQWAGDNLEFFSCAKGTDNNIKARPSTRNPLLVAGVIVTSYSALKALYNMSVDLHEGRWNDFFKDWGDWGYSQLEGEIKGGGPFVDLAEIRAEQIKAEQEVHNKRQLYGDASISISSINQNPDGSYTIYADVKGLSTIQNKISVVSETSYAEYANNVYAGLACRKSYPAFFDYNDYCTQEYLVTDGNTSDKYLKFELPRLDKGKYYLKPYLFSTINLEINSSSPYVSYGPQKEINVIGGKITKFDIADVYAVTENDDSYAKFTLYFSAEVDFDKNIEEWGIYYMENGTPKRYSASWPTSVFKDEVRVEIEIPRSEFDNIDYDNFIATKKKEFGVYIKHKNPQGAYDYTTYEYGPLSTYDLTYDKDVKFNIKDCRVLSIEPYSDADGRDRSCVYEYTVEVDGCLFFNRIIKSSIANWSSDFSFPIIINCNDNSTLSLQSAYYYFSKGTNVGAISFAAILGNMVYFQFPVTLYCDNGTVYVGNSQSKKRSDSNTFTDSDLLPLHF